MDLLDRLRDGSFADPVALASRLIGWRFTVAGVGGIIAETEAYSRDDAASHSFRGPRTANAAMFGPPGTIYVYRSYGLHWCLNIVSAPGAAVLLRALEPTDGLAVMAARRGEGPPERLCAGPGNLARALGVTGAHDGLSIFEAPFALLPVIPAPTVVTGPRIGISRETARPWRFGLSGSRSLSRPFPRGGL
jgi:DNA-3-methyladenine glycosylase